MIIMIPIIMLYMIKIHDYIYIHIYIYYTFIIPLFFSIINKPDWPFKAAKNTIRILPKSFLVKTRRWCHAAGLVSHRVTCTARITPGSGSRNGGSRWDAEHRRYCLMVQKSGDHQLRLVVYLPFFTGFQKHPRWRILLFRMLLIFVREN